MKFVADESIEAQIVEDLRKSGHSVRYIGEMDSGIKDDAVIDISNKEKAILLTADKDFGELVFRQNRIAPGIILIRLSGLNLNTKIQIVSSSVKKYHEQIPKAFTVITAGRIRIRKKEFK